MAGRLDLLRLHGDDPIAYATLQPGLRYLDASYGYIAYGRAFGIDITLGPPVAAPADQATLISRFLRTRSRPVLCYLRAPSVLPVLAASDRPLHVAGMGIDRRIDLPLGQPASRTFDDSKLLRGARKHAQRAQFSMAHVTRAALSAADRQRLADITAAYLHHSQLPYEMRFLNRPLCLDANAVEDGTRLFLLQQRQETFGYAVCNPWYAAGQVAGYLLDIVRCRPTRQWGVYYAVVAELRRQLAAEGIPALSLGYCPLYKASQADDLASLTSARLVAQVRALERHLAAVPYVARLREIKDALPGRDEPRYFASFTPHAAAAFVALMGASGVSLSSLLGPSLWRSLRAGQRAPERPR